MRRGLLVAVLVSGSFSIGYGQQPDQSRGGGPPSADLSVDRLRFEPGARSAWHSHERGQLLFTEQGRGQTQKRGQAIRILGVGDYDYTPPNVEHWHGAASDSPYVEVQVNWLTQAQQSAQPRAPLVETSNVVGHPPAVMDSSDLVLSRQRREPRNRSNWHLHEVAQLLFIEEGKARIQHRGWPMREYGVGQADYTKGVEHWQGAAADSHVLFVQLSWGGATKQYDQPTDATYDGK
jgi:quercetin dioxygenase-like cupin family protein